MVSDLTGVFIVYREEGLVGLLICFESPYVETSVSQRKPRVHTNTTNRNTEEIRDFDEAVGIRSVEIAILRVVGL